jgi:precorrin-6A/cobalt-precorrin-6A reductase
MRVLVLGGSTEATEVLCVLAGDSRFEITLSLAGRTMMPKAQPVPVRSGGFGGIDGMIAWLAAHGTEAVIDATHPFAAQISGNAVAACGHLKLPLASIGRPVWQPIEGDDWRTVDSVAEAAAVLGATPRRVLLTVGRTELCAFAAAPQHCYVARMVDPPGDTVLPPALQLLFERGPFNDSSETALLEREAIEVIVSKNSGGAAAYPKIAAARRRGIPVVMIARPDKPRGQSLQNAAAAVHWLEALLAHGSLSRSARGV